MNPCTRFSERLRAILVQAVQGTYGEYLLGKVSKAFPELRNQL